MISCRSVATIVFVSLRRRLGASGVSLLLRWLYFGLVPSRVSVGNPCGFARSAEPPAVPLKEFGGAIYVAKGTVLFDGAAIADTYAVRGERAARRHHCGCNGLWWANLAIADQCHAQAAGGAIYLDESPVGGSVTFRGNSTISRTSAGVRFPDATPTDERMPAQPLPHSE